MTVVDSLMMKKIPNHELHGQGWTKEKSPHITAVINRFNKTSVWASIQVVMGSTVELRVMAITHLVRVAAACLDHHNFFALLAIVAGLTSTPISRLNQTWNAIDYETTKCFEKLKDLVSIHSKFKGLREAQESVEGPCVPYLGVYLNDITFIEDGNISNLNEELINFEKIQMLSNIILKFKKLNSTTYSFRFEPTIHDYLNQSLQLTEDEIFEESYKRESRVNTESSKTKSKKKKNVFGFILPEI